MQVIELGLVLLYLGLILGDPLLVLGCELGVLLFELLDLPLPLVVPLVLKKLNLVFELLYNFFFLLKLPIDHAIRSKIARFAPTYSSDEILRIIAS